MEAKFAIKTRRNSHLYWILKAPNGQAIAELGAEYMTKIAVLNAIAAVQKYAGDSNTEIIEE